MGIRGRRPCAKYPLASFPGNRGVSGKLAGGIFGNTSELIVITPGEGRIKGA
jgi:hypothetical protein